MATYVYKAKKKTSETVTGTINAQSQDEAIDLINQLGFLPVLVVPKEEAVSNRPRFKKAKVSVKSKDLYTFSRQLANLIKSGVSIIKALSILEEQTQNRVLKEVIAQLTWDIKNGDPLSQAMEKFPTVFSALFVTMVRAGEESGNLQNILLTIADHQKRQEGIRSKVRTAMAYPMLMLGVGVITVYFILTFVLPKMSSLFDNLGDTLPLPTVILIKISNFLSTSWYLGILGMFVIYFLWKKWKESRLGQSFLSRFILKIPLFGSISLQSELARFSRTFVLLHKGGVSILRALEISIPILSNEVIKKRLMTCKEQLTSGGSFGQALKECPEIPSIMGHMIAVGEESGNLDEVLEDLASTYEQETGERIKVMTTLLEPIMILGIGVIVGFIVFAMLLPIFQIDVLNQ